VKKDQCFLEKWRKNHGDNGDCLFEIWRKNKAKEDMSRNELKRFDIIEAAKTVFLKKGFELTSMDEIAKEAGVSKRTVYSNFGSKENLFSGLMSELCNGKREAVSLEIDPNLPIEQALTELGERFLSVIFECEGITLMRMMIGNANTFPEIGKSFFQNGPLELINYVGEYLTQCQEKNLIQIEDPYLASQSLLASMYGAEQIRCLITGDSEIEENMRYDMVKTAVKQFLYGVTKK